MDKEEVKDEFALRYKDLIKKPDNDDMMRFSHLVNIENWEGVKVWHHLFTPWCSKDTIEEYIKIYKH